MSNYIIIINIIIITVIQYYIGHFPVGTQYIAALRNVAVRALSRAVQQQQTALAHDTKTISCCSIRDARMTSGLRVFLRVVLVRFSITIGP